MPVTPPLKVIIAIVHVCDVYVCDVYVCDCGLTSEEIRGQCSRISFLLPWWVPGLELRPSGYCGKLSQKLSSTCNYPVLRPP